MAVREPTVTEYGSKVAASLTALDKELDETKYDTSGAYSI